MSRPVTRNITININGKEVENSVRGIGREIGVLEAQMKKAEIGSERFKELGKQLEETKKKYQEVNNELRRASGEAKKHQGSLGGLLGSITGITLGVTSLVAIFSSGIRIIGDFVGSARELEAQSRGIEFAFNDLGRAGEDAFEKIKEVSRGVFSDLEIKKTLVELDDFNISLEDTGDLMEFVAIKAAQTGKDVVQLKDRFVKGIGSESKVAMRALGITTEDLNEELEKTPDFLQAISNIAKREIAQAGNILDAADSSTAKWNASLQNAQLTLGKILAGNTFIQSFKDLGRAILDVVFPTETLTQRIQEEQLQLNLLVTSITDTNISNKDRAVLIEQLKREYPSFLDFIKEEELTNDNLSIALREVNELYIKRIALQSQQDKIEQLLQKSGERTANVVRARVEIERELARINRDVLGSALDLTNTSFSERIELVRQSLRQSDVVRTNRMGTAQTLNTEAQALNNLNSLIEKNNHIARRRNKITAKAEEEQKLLQEMEEVMGTTLTSLNALFGVNTEEKRKNIETTRKVTSEEQKLLEAKQKAEADLLDFLKRAEEDRAISQMGALDRELALIDRRYEVQLDRARQFGLDTADLEAQQRLERHDAEVEAILTQQERINQIEEENRLLKEEAELERELEKVDTEREKEEMRLEFARQKALDELARLEEEELAKVEVVENAEALKAAIRENYALQADKVNREFDNAERNLRNDQVKWTEMTEEEKLNAIVGALSAASEAFNQGAVAWKAVKIAETTIATYQAAQNSYNSLSGIPIVGPALGAVAAAFAVAAGIQRVRQIEGTKMQEIPRPKPVRVKGYFDGGFTGDNAIGHDQHGKITGYVHDNEWVAPKHMTQNPRYANTIGWLEQERQRSIRGYFDGGPVGGGSDIPAPVPSQSDEEMKAILRAIAERLETEPTVKLTFGYEEEERRQAVQEDIKNSKQNGILSP